VLVAEDDVLVRLMIADALRDQGLTVIEAANADEALSVLQSSAAVSLLLTDIQMPGNMDGLVLAAFVHETLPATKVILTSGVHPKDSLPAAAHAFFLKPYDVTALVGQVKELLTDCESDGKRR